MGLFESLKRMANGEPVFQEGDANKGWVGKNGQPQGAQPPQVQQPGAPAPEKRSSIVKGQASTFPVVVVKRTRTQVGGTSQTVYCSIVNRFNEAVEVEEIHLAGSSRRLGGYLRAGEEREWLCYSGPCLKSEAYKEASLNYKVDESGDYFQSIYDVEYEYDPQTKTYSVEELHYRAPIRDIYG